MKVEIHSKLSGSGTKIFIDDKEITNCTEITFNVGARTIPEVKISLIPDEVIINGDAHLVIGKTIPTILNNENEEV